MSGQPPTLDAFSDEAIEVARAIATKHVRGDRFASLLWAVIFGVGFLVFLGFCIGGSFKGHNAAVGEIALGVLILFILYGTLVGFVQETRTLASLKTPPRQLRLTSEGLRRMSSDRRISLHDRSGVIGTARVRRARPLTSLAVPIEVLVFGELAPGHRVVCVDPRHGLTATCTLERAQG